MFLVVGHDLYPMRILYILYKSFIFTTVWFGLEHHIWLGNPVSRSVFLDGQSLPMLGYIASL